MGHMNDMTNDAVLPRLLCEQLCNALAREADPQAALRQIDAARHALLGPGLLTVNLDATRPGDPPDEIQLQRGWTSNPEAYPVGGRKRKMPTPWTEHLLRRGEVFIGEGEGALAAVFDDYSTIAALGWRSVINVPLFNAGRVCATFNVLGSQTRWTPVEVASVRLLALLATPHVLRLPCPAEVDS